MLGQTDRFGTPIVKALSVFSDTMRMQRRQRAEEMAAKDHSEAHFSAGLIHISKHFHCFTWSRFSRNR